MCWKLCQPALNLLRITSFLNACPPWMTRPCTRAMAISWFGSFRKISLTKYHFFLHWGIRRAYRSPLNVVSKAKLSRRRTSVAISWTIKRPALNAAIAGSKGEEPLCNKVNINKPWAICFVWKKFSSKGCFACTVWSSQNNDFFLWWLCFHGEGRMLPNRTIKVQEVMESAASSCVTNAKMKLGVRGRWMVLFFYCLTTSDIQILNWSGIGHEKFIAGFGAFAH